MLLAACGSPIELPAPPPAPPPPAPAPPPPASVDSLVAAPLLVGVPTNVTVTAQDRKAFIGWDPVNGANWNRIEWETDPQPLAVGTGAVDVTHGGAPAPPLPGNTLYVYTVTRADHSTVVVSAMPVPDDPTIPSGVSLTPGPRNNRLSWNAVTGAIAYRVYWSFWSFSGGVTSSNATVIEVVSGTTYTHEDLEPGTDYHYAVTAVFSQVEEGRSSAEVGGRPGETAPVTVTVGNRTVTLAWTDAIESIAYVASQAELVAPPFTFPFEVSPLDNDRRYGFRVVPHFPSGEGRPSTRVYATPAAPPYTIPAALPSDAPRGVRLTAGPGYNTITWPPPVTGATSYDLTWWRSLDTTGPPDGVFSGLSGTTYRHAGLDTCTTLDTPCPTYAYVVSVSGSTVGFSEVAAVSIPLHPFPPLITNRPVVRLTGLKPSRSHITLNGNEIVGPTRETWFEYPTPLSEGPNSLTFVALDEQGNSSTDAVYQITLDVTPPSPPQVTTRQCVSSPAGSLKATFTGKKDPYTAILQLGSDNVEQLLVGSDAQSTWTATPDVTSGTVTLIAKDIAGNAASPDVLTPACP
ncbi:MAG: fibronectin type III domain-containing protein [Nitrospirae bacterium]|nr:fibronectin type III domain-containing protein [Nitrospirota bacterium]